MADTSGNLQDPPSIDYELAWIMTHAPKPMKAFIHWQMNNAFRVHPTFALFSALLFFQSVIGRNVRLPRDLRVNLWMLLFAPTESGKGAAINLAAEALKQLEDKKIFSAVPHFSNRFGSPEAILWRLSEVPQVIWVNEEMVRLILDITAAKIGTSQYNMGTLLLDLHDAAVKPYVDPIRYSGRDKRCKEMNPLSHPFFSAIGTGVLRAIGDLTGATAEDGSLNRYLPFVVDVLPPMKRYKPITPLPDEVVNWAAAIQAKKFVEFFDPDGSPPSGVQPYVLEVYPEFENDCIRESEYGARRSQNLPGIWGRYTEKILQVTLLYAMADSMKVTREGFDWAKRLVHWTVSKFAQHFADEGGGGANIHSRMQAAFMAFFEKTIVTEPYATKGYVPDRVVAQGCRLWKDNPKERPVVLRALEGEGQIVVDEWKAGGTRYHRQKPEDEV
ncbi:hypothetical protein JFU47_32140 [Pseudomonas sp. TH39(2020)]|uniref:hypothetical protein n=1 Tax=Pseudomonas sp. TH39(2020) TaxID=2796349 RepID=UPI001914C452|nr:hypothetical protein [Pseudomonas sp. TH39(2020)]MBK5401328.1 hypothetical protein [Pseudomonas sp. TH39(2020)]